MRIKYWLAPHGFSIITSTMRLCFHPCLLAGLLVCWFVSRITQKLLNRFPPNLDGGRVSAQNGPHQLLEHIQINGQRQELFLKFLLPSKIRLFSNIVVNFSGNKTWILIKKISGVFRWLVSMREYNLMERALVLRRFKDSFPQWTSAVLSTLLRVRYQYIWGPCEWKWCEDCVSPRQEGSQGLKGVKNIVARTWMLLRGHYLSISEECICLHDASWRATVCANERREKTTKRIVSRSTCAGNNERSRYCECLQEVASLLFKWTHK